MLIDGIELTEGSILKNPTLARGPQFPDSPDAGELFFNTSMLALCIYTGYDWSELGAVKSVAGKSGVVLLDVNDVSGAFAANKVGVADGAYRYFFQLVPEPFGRGGFCFFLQHLSVCWPVAVAVFQ